MNILIRGVESYKKYQTRILSKVFEHIECEKCVIIARNHDKKDKYDNRYVVYNLKDVNYKKHDCDINELHSIPESVLLGMQRFESKIYECVMRECNLPVYSYTECKQMYFDELIFWYSVIINNKIEYMIFHNAPHMLHDYVIYCLGQAMGIETLLFMPTFFPGRLEWGTDYVKMGTDVADNYKRLLEEKVSPILPKDLEELYLRYKNGFKKEEFKVSNKKNKELWKKANDLKLAFVMKEYIQNRRELLLESIRTEKDIRRRKAKVEELQRDIELTNRCKKYLKNDVINVKTYSKYDKLSKTKKGEKYIYFALQHVPESNLMPKIDAFYEQKFSIFVLAQAAKKYGLSVYVKEHYVQEVRNKDLYEFIKSLSNVKLFGPEESNLELMKNSVAVSTASGSCIFEAMFNNMASITFGDGYWNSVPGCFRVYDEKTCCEAIRKILKKEYEVNDYNIKIYLQAIAESTVSMDIYQMNKYGSKLTDKECIDNISTFLIKKLSEHTKNV